MTLDIGFVMTGIDRQRGIAGYALAKAWETGNADLLALAREVASNANATAIAANQALKCLRRMV